MTTAHRPTFDPARGRNVAAPSSIYHAKLLPAHTQLKYRKKGQLVQNPSDPTTAPILDLKAQLLLAEQDHFKKVNGEDSTDKTRRLLIEGAEADLSESDTNKRKFDDITEESAQERKQKILEKYRDMDAEESDSESSDSSDTDSDEEDSEEEDETAQLMLELERIKKERAEEKERKEQEKQERNKEERDREIAYGNPLLNPDNFNIKKGWTDETLFKHQAVGADRKGRHGLINDMLRSDFHKKFMSKYIR